MARQPADDLLDVVRVLLLLQAAILVATTIEALIWGFAFGASSSFLMSAVAASAVLIARARLRADRRWSRRAVYVVEGLILVTLAIDALLALLITHGAPPPVAVLTRFLLPVSVIALLRRSTRAIATPTAAVTVAAKGAS